MPTPIEVPRLGESITSAILLQWLKKDGETDRQGRADRLMLETDKANADLNAPGRRHPPDHTRQPGETPSALVTEAIGQIEAAGEASSQAARRRPLPPPPQSLDSQPAAPSPTAATMAPEDLTPAVRVLVQEHKPRRRRPCSKANAGRAFDERVRSSPTFSRAAQPAPTAKRQSTRRPCRPRRAGRSHADPDANRAAGHGAAERRRALSEKLVPNLNAAPAKRFRRRRRAPREAHAHPPGHR